MGKPPLTPRGQNQSSGCPRGLAALLARCVTCPASPAGPIWGLWLRLAPLLSGFCCLPSSLAQSAPSFWPRPRLGISPALGCQLSTGSGDPAQLGSHCSRSSTAQKHRLKVEYQNIQPVAVCPGVPLPTLPQEPPGEGHVCVRLTKTNTDMDGGLS